jgi:putative flippase GtrA
LRHIPASIRYTLVGVTCAVLNNVLLIAVAAAGFDYLSGVSIVCVPMLVIGFMLHCTVTFKTKATLGAFLRYSGGILANYPIFIACLFLACDIAHLPVFVAAPIATVVLFVWNYVAARWAIARAPRRDSHGTIHQTRSSTR